MGKKKISRKGRAKIIVAVITAITAITVACISLIGKNEKSYSTIPNRVTSHTTQSSVADTCEKLSQRIYSELESIYSKSENNSGVIVTGKGNNVYYNSDYPDAVKEENVTLIGEMLPYLSGGVVNNESICMYSGDGYEPIYDFSLLNENKVTINIKNIFMEVLDYKNFNEFIVKNPAGGADLLDIIYWSCNITPKKARYHVALTGTDENNTEDLSGTQYVSIKASDSGKFHLKIFPDTPGLYEAKLIIEYTSYEGTTKEIFSDNMKFIYDPNHEVITEFNGAIYHP